MTHQFKLRPYQTEAIDAVFKAWEEGLTRPAIVLPTGAGKTVVFSHLVKQWRKSYEDHYYPPHGIGNGDRVMILAHRDELVDQAIDKIRKVAPDLRVGKVKAGDNDIDADVMVCSVQTLAVKRRRDALADAQQAAGHVGLIITDECHHAAAVSYQKVYDAFPDALQLGVTATMARGDGVGLGSTWEEVVYSRSILWMISQGFLTDVKAKRVQMDGLRLDDVKRSSGDYQAGDLGKQMMDAHADDVITRAYLDHALDRRTIVFTPTVDVAEATSRALNESGVPAAFVSGETPREERQRIYEDFRTGHVQVLANCMVLTEGFDAPWASCAIIARPTQSQPLYVQMVGRVLRPHPGKEDALVLDVAGTGGQLRTLIDLEPGAVGEVEEDETLAEAVVREAEAADQVAPAGSVAFSLKHREVSLFAASERAWNQTLKGVRFIGCGQTTVFLWPAEGGTWDVCTMQPGQRWQRTAHTGLDLSLAMAWGEAVAEDNQNFSVARSASWRKAKASEKQINMAMSLGIPGAESMRKGELSEAIDKVMKSRAFDPYTP